MRFVLLAAALSRRGRSPLRPPRRGGAPVADGLRHGQARRARTRRLPAHGGRQGRPGPPERGRGGGQVDRPASGPAVVAEGALATLAQRAAVALGRLARLGMPGRRAVRGRHGRQGRRSAAELHHRHGRGADREPQGPLPVTEVRERPWMTALEGLGYAFDPLDRCSYLREDAAAVAALRARPDARAVLIARDMPVFAQEAPRASNRFCRSPRPTRSDRCGSRRCSAGCPAARRCSPRSCPTKRWSSSRTRATAFSTGACWSSRGATT